jgi:hypothetical protein
MADENPTGGRRAVPLGLPAEHVAIVRLDLEVCLEGVEGDLEMPERMPNPEKARREAEAYKRLLAGLDRGEIVLPDEIARETLKERVVAVDNATEYARVVVEHDALHGLLAVLEGNAADAAR